MQHTNPVIPAEIILIQTKYYFCVKKDTYPGPGLLQFFTNENYEFELLKKYNFALLLMVQKSDMGYRKRKIGNTRDIISGKGIFLVNYLTNIQMY